MDTQEERLRQLVAEACRHLPGSTERQQSLTKIIRLTTPKLWKEHTSYYQDALQQTWMHFCQNICEQNTGQKYDSARSSVATWLNNYLRRRLQDFYVENRQQEAKRVVVKTRTSRTGEADGMVDPIDNLEAKPDIPPLLEEVRAWAETDAGGELRRIHLEGRPEVNCQVLILRRLPPETSWKDLAAEFDSNISTLSRFYQRQCLPRLHKFGESEGYL